MRRSLCGFLAAVGALTAFAADEPAGPGPAVLTDANGKEVKLKTWQFTAGTRRLEWLAADKAKAPLAVEFRDANSTLFREGILTLIPVERLKGLRYDAEKQTVEAEVAGVEEPLAGSTRYKGINVLTVEAEIDLGEAGVADVKYRGGPGGNVRAVRFEGARAPEKKPAGEAFTVQPAEPKQKLPASVVYNLKALYRGGKEGGYVVLPTVTFKKTLKLDLGKIQKLHIPEPPDRGEDAECAVTLKDGTEQTLTLLSAVTIDGKPAVLEGLVGEVPAGYKLFPIHTVAELHAGEPKPEPKAEPKREKDAIGLGQ